MYWHMKHIPAIGFGTTFILDKMLLLFSMLADDDEKVIAKNLSHNIRAINPVGLVPIVGSDVGKFITEEAVKAAFE